MKKKFLVNRDPDSNQFTNTIAAIKHIRNLSTLIKWMAFFLVLFFSASACHANDKKKGKAEKTDEVEKVIAFPGAQGYGQYVTGGRGGKVLFVENLNDDGPGSLRDAVDKDYPRIVVFRISGTIALNSPLKINDDNITIAGQTAPGDGICLRNYSLIVSADNVIIRFMRFRMGDLAKYEGDALGGTRHKDIIIDHCSMSWGTDEVATFYDNENFTLQWCIIAESLNVSVHHKGAHGYGGIWGGMGASFHHNLLADNSSRNPRFCGSRYHKQPDKEIVDFRNNVIYNWGHNSSYGGEEGNHNMINNYYRPGPATKKSVRDRIINPYKPYGKFYVDGNFVEGSKKVSENNWSGGVQCDDIEAVKSEKPFPFIPVVTQSPEKAYELVLEYAGASLVRDKEDTRIINEVRTGTSTYSGSSGGISGIIDRQEDVGGWPELRSATPPVDSDQDGMPDQWEEQNGLNPNDPADVNKRNLDKNYDNVEMYLNSLVQDITEGQQVEK